MSKDEAVWVYRTPETDLCGQDDDTTQDQQILAPSLQKKELETINPGRCRVKDSSKYHPKLS
jgi:hypothetical protein